MKNFEEENTVGDVVKESCCPYVIKYETKQPSINFNVM